jgi:nicotinamidase-related amidase
MRVWDDILTEADRAVIAKGGYGKSRGFGKKPLLLIIDLQPNYIGADKPIAEQLDEWPSGGGETAWRCVERILSLRDAAREAGIPIFYTKNVQRQTLRFDAFSAKTNRDQTKYLDGNPASDLLPIVKPIEGELVISKSYPSAFYGTPLTSYLIGLSIDTLIIVGGSTGGCCRATAVDAVTLGYNLGYVQDCLFDRIEASHKTTLLDVWMKYGDIPTSDEVKEYFKSLKK